MNKMEFTMFVEKSKIPMDRYSEVLTFVISSYNLIYIKPLRGYYNLIKTGRNYSKFRKSTC
jgi:hypothetical protein